MLLFDCCVFQDSELAMFSEMTLIQEIMDGLNAQALETSLLTSSENVGVQDAKKPDAVII